MNSQQFVDSVIAVSRKKGFVIETNRDGLLQIDFGNKKLHANHLISAYPEIMVQGANVAKIIERVAPGRPCTHKPMREIISEIARESIKK